MRAIVIILMIPVLNFSTKSQQETLINGTYESTIFGAPVVKISPLGATTGFLVGGRIGWIINRTFAVGGGGYGLLNNVRARTPGPDGERYMNMGYGGVEFEYIHNYDEMLHYTFYTLIGAGGVGYRHHDHSDDVIDWSRVFFVLEPGANFELNVMEIFRFAFGISYRYVSGLNTGIANDEQLSGISGVLMFKFGRF